MVIDPASASPPVPLASYGLVLAPFRATRPRMDGPALAGLLCPPYDVIDSGTRARLLAAQPDNFVAIALPDPTPAGYANAAALLEEEIRSGTLAVDEQAALYIYEMTAVDGQTTRGLVGAVELRDPADGVILPHENTMAGPVADRLALMLATDADLEPIYLLYDGGGDASAVVGAAGEQPPVCTTTTADGTRHRVWAVTDPNMHARVAADLARRRAVIADGHHRYATYRERQRIRTADAGPGAWDFGLAFVVDSTSYGPQVHPIHRVVRNLSLDRALHQLSDRCTVVDLPAADALSLSSTLETVLPEDGRFAAVLTDGMRAVRVQDDAGRLRALSSEVAGAPALATLDVTVLHRAVIEAVWGVPDDVDHVGYAHSVDEAVDGARAGGGLAVLLRPTPAAAVAAVAAAGERMPRKSTLFTPKPASGLFVRRLSDHHIMSAPAGPA